MSHDDRAWSELGVLVLIQGSPTWKIISSEPSLDRVSRPENGTKDLLYICVQKAQASSHRMLCSECFQLTAEKQDEQWVPARAGQLESTQLFSANLWVSSSGLLSKTSSCTTKGSACSVWETLFCSVGAKQWDGFKKWTRCYKVNYPLKSK